MKAARRTPGRPGHEATPAELGEGMGEGGPAGGEAGAQPG
jgi:hypothetical protein